MDDLDLVQLYRQNKRQETERYGTSYLESMANSGMPGHTLTYAAQELAKATSPEHAKSIAQGLMQEFGGLEETNVPGTITGAVGNFKEHPIASGIEIAASPLKILGSGALVKGSLASKAAQLPLQLGAADILGKTSEAMVSPIINPEEHPIANIAGQLGAFGAQLALGKGVTSAARSAVLDKLASGAALPMAADIIKGATPEINPLASQTGAVTLNPIKGISERASDLWNSTAGEKIQAGVDYLTRVPLMPKDTRFSRYLGGNNLYDMFVAPMERAPAAAGRSFLNTVTEQMSVANALDNVAGKVLGLNLSAKEDLYRLLKGNMNINLAKPENRDLLAGILEPYSKAIEQSRRKLLPKAQHDALYNNRMEEQLTKMFAEDTDNPAWKAFRDNWQGELSTPEGTQKFLKAVLNNPLLRDSPVYKLAYDLHDLPMKTAGDVARANKNAFETVLFNKVKSNPSWVIDKQSLIKRVMNELGVKGQATMDNILKLPPDKIPQAKKLLDQFVPMPGHDMFEGLLVHKDIAEGIRDLDTAQSSARRIWNTYYLNPWKFMKTILNPPARLRDPISQIIFNDVAGAHPLSPFNVSPYIKAVKEMKKQGQYAKDFAYYTGVDSGSWVNVEIRPILNAFKHGAGMLEMPYKWLYDNPYSKTMADFTQFADTWTKLAKYIHNVEQGMPKSDAAIDALRVGGNHLYQARATRAIRDTAMPFFGWQVHALKTMGHGFIHHPVRTAKYFAIPAMMGQQAIESLGMSEDDWKQYKEALPEYMKDEVMGMPTHIPLATKDEKGRIQMFDIGWWLPGLQDMAELGRSGSTLTGFMQNPAISTFAALKDNKKFSGAPIYHEWEDGGTKAAKQFGYVMQQILPSWAPGVGTSWEKITASLDETNTDPNKMTPEQAIGNQMGYKVTPFDQGLTIKRNQDRLKAWMNEAKGQMRRELSKTSDREKQQEIVLRYKEIFANIAAEMRGGEIDAMGGE